MKQINLLILVVLISFHSLCGQSINPKATQATLQGTLYGVINNCDSGDPMQNVTVKAVGSQQFVTETDASGYYEMLVNDGVYNVEFILVGYGSFPVGGSFLGSEMAVGVIDDDGAYGLPGTVMDSTIITVNNYGWVDHYGVFDVTFEDGDFYLAMWQLGNDSNSAPIGIDTDVPTSNLSYEMTPGSNTWNLSSNHDFMIRAYVDGPNQGVLSGNRKSRDLVHYTIARVSNFDPCLGPESGTLTPIANSTVMCFHDNLIGGIPLGIFAWAAKANYESNSSAWLYSNIVAPLGDNYVTFNISLCDGSSSENTVVTMIRDTCQFITYQFIADSNGIATIDTVLDGRYDITIDNVGYELFEMDSVYIFSDTTFYVELMQKKYPPRNLFVDSLTNIATWDEPLITALSLETFEDTIFPPEGWSDFTMCPVGWHRADYDSTPGFIVPRADGFFAVTDNLNVICDHSSDYLILPVLDLRESDDFSLHFDQYFTGANQQAAYVRYGYNGISWEVLETMTPNYEWTNINISLSNFSGSNKQKIWLSFHAHDYDIVGSGWAVDNVSVTAGPAEILGYNIYLDGVLIDSTSVSQNSYAFAGLIYGQDYNACVEAIYDCGVSEQECFSWGSMYTSTPDILDNDFVNIYPNPAKDRITIASTSPINKISITNYVGQVVFSSNMDGVTNKVINTGNYQPGVYLVEIKTRGGEFAKKILITK